MKPHSNSRGIALLVTLFAVTIMIFLAVEMSYTSRVERIIGAAELDRVRAYYLARSGVELSLVRIHIFRTALKKFGAQLGQNKGMLDLIWQFPLSWPPMLPGEATEFDKSSVNDIIKNSLIDGAYTTSIQSEGGKIDLNDLASPSKALQESTKALLVQMVKNRLEQDDDWAKDNRNLRAEEIVNNIGDWVDEDSESRNGGAEASFYSGTDITPANRSFKTLDELHMVAGITDEIYNLIAPRATVYGVKGVNVNQASAEVLKSIDKRLNDEIVGEIIKRRSDPLQGPFGTENDLKAFVASKGIPADSFNTEPHIPLIFDSEINFAIRTTGIYGKARREIFAIVYDFDKVKEQLSGLLATSPSPGATAAQTNPTASPSPGMDSGTGGAAAGAAPQIVYWQEN